MVKVTFCGQYLEKMPRATSMKISLQRHGYKVEDLKLKVKGRRFGKYGSALLRYGTYAIQELLVNTDIMHLFNVPDFIHAPSLLKRCHIVYDCRTVYSYIIHLVYPQLSRAAGFFEKQLARKADVVTAANNLMAEVMRGITDSPVLVVPNYPSREFRPKKRREEARSKYAPEGRKVVLYVGALDFAHDMDLILESAKRIPEATFLIAGDGPRREEIIDKTKGLPNVKYIGWVSHDDVPDVINAADVCVEALRVYYEPILHDDQDMWKIAEYASLKKPIVVTGLAPSPQYHLAEPATFADGIKRALEGKTSIPQPRLWEDHSEPSILKAYSYLADR